MKAEDKNRKSKLSDFMKYTGSKMTGKERNAFERELQKDPFAEEATEGLSGVPSEEAASDLAHLKKQLKVRISRRQRFVYYRVAASIAVLMIISTVFIVIDRKRPDKQLSENAEMKTEIELPESKVLSEPIAKRDDKRTTSMPQAQDQSKIIKPATEGNKEEIRQLASVKKAQVAVARPVNLTDTAPENVKNIVAEAKISEAQDVLKVSNIMEEAAAGGNAVKSKMEIITSAPVSRSEIEKKAPVIDYHPAQPVDGEEYFNRYIQENIQLPDTSFSIQKATVVISFLVCSTGVLDSIKIISSPGQSFSNEAVRLIKKGPSWKPADKHGKPVDDEVRIRIIFN